MEYGVKKGGRCHGNGITFPQITGKKGKIRKFFFDMIWCISWGNLG